MNEVHPEQPSQHATRPSLFGSEEPPAAGPLPQLTQPPRTLVDPLYDGFYLLSLLKDGQMPGDAPRFAVAVKHYLDDFAHAAKKQGASIEDIGAAQYALCAAVDETLLTSGAPIRDDWERRPLQLTLFGDQLAGEHFFDRLEQLRAEGVARLQVLEVYHWCLLLGFQGKYALEGSEKLSYLTARLGDEIAALKGRRAAFAPHWQAPDSIVHTLKRAVPIWGMISVCALLALLAFIGVDARLAHTTRVALNAYHHVVQLRPSAAHLTITLP